ncbi:hypothetical protein GCM10009623_29270 [Nocardioides aestuarii]
MAVRARMLSDPAYDAWLRADRDPAARFADEALRTHRRTNRVLDGSGRVRLPWPRALGTTPWALARELGGAHHVTLVVDREAAWQRLTDTDAPSPLFVGSSWLPRHVVLVLGVTGDRLTAYEPSAGAEATVDRDAFVGADLRLGGWDRPWFTVTPAG